MYLNIWIVFKYEWYLNIRVKYKQYLNINLIEWYLNKKTYLNKTYLNVQVFK